MDKEYKVVLSLNAIDFNEVQWRLKWSLIVGEEGTSGLKSSNDPLQDSLLIWIFEFL